MGKTKIAKKTTKKQTIPTPKCAKTQQKLVRKKRVRARNIVEKEEPKEPPRKTRAPGHLISPPINKRMLKPPVYPDSVDSETDQSSRESVNKLSFHHIKGTEHGRQPRTPPVGFPPPQVYPPHGYPPPRQGCPPLQGYLPPRQEYAPPQWYPQGYPPPQGYPQGYPPPPQGYLPQGYTSQGYLPQGYTSQGYPPQGYPPLEGYPRQYVPPQSHDKRNYPELRNISSQDVGLTDGDDDDDDDDDGDDDFDSDDD